MSYYYVKKTTDKAPVVSIPDGADTVPIKAWGVTLPASLSGYSAVECFQTGKNLLNYADITTSYRITSLTDNGGGSFTVVASGLGAYIDHIIQVKAGQTYSIKCTSATNDAGNASQIGVVNVYDGSDDTAALLLNGASISTRKGFTPTGNYILVRNKVTGGSGAGTGTIVEPQLELGSTATTYTPYVASTQNTVSLGRTIYGGSVDVVNGTGTETWECIPDLSQLSWTLGTSGCFVAELSGYQNCTPLCSDSDYETSSVATSGNAAYLKGDKTVCLRNTNNGNAIYIRDDDYSDADTFQASLSNVKLVYQLATPTDFTFDGQEIPTRLGYNAFWSDEGDSQITYYSQEEADDNYIIKESTLTNIANSIRAKTGNSAPIFVEDMDDEILNIETGGDLMSVMCESTFDLTPETCPTESTKIPERMFSNNPRIRTINMSGITEVEHAAFYQCGATSINLPDCKTIGTYAFYQARGASDVPLSIPNITSIGDEAFRESYVCGESTANRYLDISKCVSIGSNAFRSTRINGFKLDSVETLGDCPWFSGWFSMTNAVFPKLKTCGGQMCRNVGFTNLVIGPDWVSSGTNWAGYDADWRNKYVYIYAVTPPTMGGGLSISRPPLAIYVPADSVDAYKAANHWSSQASIIQPLPSDHLTIDTWL